MNKNTESVVENLLKQNKQVFVNDKEEIFTKESYAKSSGIPYEEVKEVKAKKKVPSDGGQSEEKAKELEAKKNQAKALYDEGKSFQDLKKKQTEQTNKL